MVNVHCALHEWNLENKRVLVRADLNVPLKNGSIENDYRLTQLLPTLKLIIEKEGKVILMSHIGRPQREEPTLSTQQLLPWFKAHNISIKFVNDFNAAYTESFKHQETVLLLENLRFFPGEQTNDPSFAQQIARLGDFYVNDAFGTLHRNDTSIVNVPALFSQAHRSIGLLVENELHVLDKLLTDPARPYLLITGGGKVKDKIPLIRHLMPHVDCILLTPAIVFTFLKANGVPVGQSLIDENAIEECKHIMEIAAKTNKKILFPVDYQISRGSIAAPLEIVSASAIPADGIGISIGPETMSLWQQEIGTAKSILFNGLSGFAERPETLTGTYSLLESIAQSNAFTVIAGGDTVGIAEKLGFDKKVSFCSTGGGATIAYLSGDSLPGLEALIR